MNSMSTGNMSRSSRCPATLIWPSAPSTVNVFRALSPMYTSLASCLMCTSVVTAAGKRWSDLHEVKPRELPAELRFANLLERRGRGRVDVVEPERLPLAVREDRDGVEGRSRAPAGPACS